MLWNANELAKISEDLKNKIVYDEKNRRSETEFPYLMKL